MRKSRRRRPSFTFTPEQLETRMLLSGNSVFDIDFDDSSTALSDGVLTLRYLAGFQSQSLVNGVVSENGNRTNVQDIDAALATLAERGIFDIDGDNATLPLSDGIILLRHLAGFTGNSLIDGAVNTNGTRTTAAEVEAWLSDLSSNAGLQQLRTDVEQIMSGTPEQLLFQAFVAAAEPTDSVGLYDVDGDGNTGAFLLPLFDDGAAIHGDAIAGDGVFSNRLAITIGDPGTRRFVAQLDSQTAPVGVRGIAAPSDETLQQRADFAANTEQTLADFLNGGGTVQDGLNMLHDELLANSSQVNTNSIEMTDASIFWDSIEGIPNALFTDELLGDRNANSNANSGQPAAPVPGSVSNAAVQSRSSHNTYGEAIVLAPYRWQFEPADESNEVAATLTNFGFDVTAKYNTTALSDQNISVEDFKNLGKYEAVIVTSHGDSHSKYGIITVTGDKVDGEDAKTYKQDLLSGRLVYSGNKFAITPKFITKYTGSMNDSIVYMGTCRGGYSKEMADAFIKQGAAAYVAFTDYVGSGFAEERGKRLFNHLTNSNIENPTVGTVAGINSDVETDSDPAKFVMFGDKDAKFKPVERLLNDYDVYVEYKWPLSQTDLDTATTFLSNKAGFSCGETGSYLDWSGDDTSAGGAERVIIDVNAAYDAGEIPNAVTAVSLAAGWYIPSAGSGPATLTFGLRNKVTGEIVDVITVAITPGMQDGCAETSVGFFNVSILGEGDTAQIAIT